LQIHYLCSAFIRDKVITTLYTLYLPTQTIFSILQLCETYKLNTTRYLQPLIVTRLLKTAHPTSDPQTQAMQNLVRIANSLHLDNTARFLHVPVV